MAAVAESVAWLAERVVGRRTLVRSARFLLNYARRDVPNRIARNGELLVQRVALGAAGDGAVIFDVGANLGQWSTALLSQSSGAVDLHVFEPASGCVMRLRETLHAPDASRVIINQTAVSSEVGTATLHKPRELAGSSSLHPIDGQTDTALLEEVTTCTIDGYCKSHGIAQIHLLKIDAEGHDYEALLGARAMLSRGAINVVQFEYNYRWMGPRYFLKDVFDLLAPNGYRIGKVTPRGIEWYERWDPRLETLVEANYVAARQPVFERFPSVAWWASGDTGKPRR